VLTPQVGQEEEDRLRREANTKIQNAEQMVQRVDQSKLLKEQQDTYTTIRSFLVAAREALSVKDFLKASNLAEKAQVLVQELVQTIR
jgi:ABC-type transporter lipoprotein component MlaA